MENREVTNREALLNKALESEFSEDERCEILTDVAQDYLREKLFYLGCAKIYKEAGDDETAENYELRAALVNAWFFRATY